MKPIPGDEVPSVRDQIRAAVDPGGETDVLAGLGALAHLGGPFREIASLDAQRRSLIDDAARSFEMLGTRGWAVLNMPTTSLAEACKLIDLGQEEEADELLADVWDDESRTGRVVARAGGLGPEDETFRAMSRERWRLLKKAREHHINGAYEASVPIVLAQIEGIVTDVADGRTFFSTSSRRQADVKDPTRLEGIPAGLAVVRAIYTASVNTTQATGGLSRHGVLHGRELAYDTRANSAKCWSLLDVVVEWALPLARDVAHLRRVAQQETHADTDAVDDDGRRLDDREFDETRDALRYISTVQMGQHRNRGRFLADVLTAWLSIADMVKRGLPEDHGVQVAVSADGQTWRGWRRTVSGWVLGIAYVAEAGTYREWLYAGPSEPHGSPLDDPATWGEVWGTPPDWRNG